MAKKDASRIEKSYEDAVRAYNADIKKMFNEMASTTEMLLRNTAESIIWINEENEIRRKKAISIGFQAPRPVTLTKEAGELTRISRIVSKLQDPRLGIMNDPDSGVRNLVLMLQAARKEYVVGKTDKIPDGTEEASDGKNKEEM